MPDVWDILNGSPCTIPFQYHLKKCVFRGLLNLLNSKLTWNCCIVAGYAGIMVGAAAAVGCCKGAPWAVTAAGICGWAAHAALAAVLGNCRPTRLQQKLQIFQILRNFSRPNCDYNDFTAHAIHSYCLPENCPSVGCTFHHRFFDPPFLEYLPYIPLLVSKLSVRISLYSLHSLQVLPLQLSCSRGCSRTRVTLWIPIAQLLTIREWKLCAGSNGLQQSLVMSCCQRLYLTLWLSRQSIPTCPEDWETTASADSFPHAHLTNWPFISVLCKATIACVAASLVENLKQNRSELGLRMLLVADTKFKGWKGMIRDEILSVCGENHVFQYPRI